MTSIENTPRALDRGHVPGYKGYCPQFKYNFGKTFGRQTLELSQQQHEQMDEQPVMDFSGIWQNRKRLTDNLNERRRIAAQGLMTDHSRQQPLPPIYTGDNTRYERNMIPGYTGYIPRWQFKFGKTYKDECGVCFNEFEAMQRMKDYEKLSALAMPKSLPNLRAIASDSNVRDYLNDLQNTGSGKNMEDKPPIPGYRGFIPHVRTSDVGLGSRFHNMAREGYEALNSQRELHEEKKGWRWSADGRHTVEPMASDRSPGYSHRSQNCGGYNGYTDCAGGQQQRMMCDSGLYQNAATHSCSAMMNH